MSALPPKADIWRVVVECPLMTQSGHWRMVKKTRRSGAQHQFNIIRKLTMGAGALSLTLTRG